MVARVAQTALLDAELVPAAMMELLRQLLAKGHAVLMVEYSVGFVTVNILHYCNRSTSIRIALVVNHEFNGKLGF